MAPSLSKSLGGLGTAFTLGAVLLAPFTFGVSLGGLPLAGSLALTGAVLSVGAALTAPGPRSRSLSGSRHYGIGQFSNPTDPDLAPPVLYGTARIIPQILQESVSTLSEGSGQGIPHARKQGINILCAVAEGELSEITDVRLNDQPVLTDSETVKVSTGNGTQKVYSLPAPWVYLPSLTVQVNSVEKHQSTSTATDYPVLPAASNAVTIGRNAGEKILTETIRVYLDGTEETRSGTYGWSVRRITKRKVKVVFRTRPPASAKIKVTFSYVGPSDLVVRQDGRGRTTLTFGTAPTSGHKIEATYRRTNFPGLVIETRMGTLDQEAIPGFGDERQSKTVAQELTKDSERTHRTAGPVNDLRIGITAPRGFVVFTDSGGLDTIRSNIVIGYAFVDSAGTLGKYRELYHLGDADKPKADWILAGQSTGPRTWEIGLRDTLQGLVNAGYADVGGLDLEDDLATLAAGTRVEVKVTRKDKVRTDAQSLDGLWFQYATEITDTLFSYPGTALLGIRAYINEGLDGAAPTVTCTATRADLYDPRTGAWDGRSDNPALAVYDLLTSGNATAVERYGSRGWFTSADVDSTTLEAWADYCDEYVHNDSSNKTASPSATNGEIRHSLNLVMDTPMALSEWVSDIAFAGGAFPVMQGVRWRFPLDKTGTASFAFTEDADPANSNIVAGSFEMGPEPLENTATDVEVTYFDRAHDWQADQVVASRDDLAETTPRKTTRITARGVDRASEASRLAERVLLHAVNNPVTASWLAHPGAIAPEAGDIVSVTTFVPGGTAASGWSAKAFRIVAMTREWPADQRAPLVRFEARVLSAKPYAVTVTASASKTAGAGTFGGSTGSGTSGVPTTSGGAVKSKIKGFRVRVK
ncbi:MAG: phage tail protein [Planctomycetes bacterium]|nr:phage tail protein [Planctomycetota bacterium]